MAPLLTGYVVNTASKDAVELLLQYRREVKRLLERYEETKHNATDAEKRENVQKICSDLLLHLEIKETIFYPRIYQAFGDDALMIEVLVEHSCAKNLIRQISLFKPSDPLFEVKLKMLAEQIEHQAAEEDREVFPKARGAKINLIELGLQLEKEQERLRIMQWSGAVFFLHPRDDFS